jgi:hypothetical protein
VVQQIVDGDHSGVEWDDLLDNSAALQGAITSASALGALLSSSLVSICYRYDYAHYVIHICKHQVFKVADLMGRRAELVVGALAYIVGAFIEVNFRKTTVL